MVNQAAVAERWPLVGRRPELSAFSHVLEDQGCDAFVVYGPRGVGKTRLAEECLQVAERAGRACGRAIASAEATAVPLAAIAHLLPADRGSKEIRAGETLDPVQLFARAKNAFEDRARGTRFVLMVDDLNLLDLTSATLLRQLLVTGTVLLLGTVLADPSQPAGCCASLARRPLPPCGPRPAFERERRNAPLSRAWVAGRRSERPHFVVDESRKCVGPSGAGAWSQAVRNARGRKRGLAPGWKAHRNASTERDRCRASRAS